MCPSCEKSRVANSAAAEQWSKMWLAKQGVPKNMKNILKTKIVFKRAVGGRVVKQTKTKNIFNQEEKLMV